jgi:hypothetical protein
MMKNKQLKKYLEKYYWNNNQKLIFDTFEFRDNDSCSLDVGIYDSNKQKIKKYLFSIYNYTAFIGLEYKADNKTIYEKWDSCVISYRPYYFNRTFLLRKWNSITEKDLLNCGEYFINNVLDLSMIFNFSINQQEVYNDKSESLNY